MPPPKYPDYRFRGNLNTRTGQYTVEADTHMPCGVSLKGTGVAPFQDRAERTARERLDNSVRTHVRRCKPHPKRPDLKCSLHISL